MAWNQLGTCDLEGRPHLHKYHRVPSGRWSLTIDCHNWKPECQCKPFVYYGAIEPGSLEPDCPIHGVAK